jgi:hypothetical protein
MLVILSNRNTIAWYCDEYIFSILKRKKKLFDIIFNTKENFRFFNTIDIQYTNTIHIEFEIGSSGVIRNLVWGKGIIGFRKIYTPHTLVYRGLNK